ncbi:hypothetical protein CEXT_631291 [Caerostris extrusa]|uniref:Uncharacterized protein n=1 Tax=Caerostris extrusa TaxID=172846 RepID=A0AAV4N7R5_CAEEX|nr:hypothetical protein CEXT_631291 [Caerostris extrusa]
MVNLTPPNLPAHLRLSSEDSFLCEGGSAKRESTITSLKTAFQNDSIFRSEKIGESFKISVHSLHTINRQETGQGKLH